MSRGKVTAMLVASVVVASTAAALSWVFGGAVPETGTPRAVTASTTASASAPLTLDEATRLADDVTSGDEKRVRAALAVSPEQPLDAAALAGLGAIESMTFDMATFREHGDGTSSVSVQVAAADGTTAQWSVNLVAVDQAWLIRSTEPVS